MDLGKTGVRLRGWLLPGPSTVALLVTAAYGLYVVWRLSAAGGGDPSFFIIAGPPTSDARTTLPNVHVFQPGTTYDGQFFYRLALEPWSQAQTADGITLDEPAYRQQRILYPLLVWALSAGVWQLTPAVLIAVNLIAVGVLAYAAAVFAAALGRNVLASSMVPFYPGYVVTISRDLAELTEAAALTVGLFLIQRRRYGLASAALVASVLARETALVVPIAGMVVWAFTKTRKHTDVGPPPLVWLTPLLGYAVWSTFLGFRWGVNPIAQGGSVNFGVPLAGLVEHLTSINLRTTRIWNTDLVELGLVGGAVCIALASYRPRTAMLSVLTLSCAIYAAAGLAYSAYVWHDDYAFLRALHELFLTASLCLVATGSWAVRVLAPSTVLIWLLFAAQHGLAP